ncbi:MAG: hypothetical protein VB092_08330 [Oscillospiraceae bacterium]|nr:hypothetical protein [Oscillospiraceae bacterium]
MKEQEVKHSKYIFLSVLMMCLVGALSACGQRDPLGELSSVLGADVGAGTVITESDSHGGFHGDGETYVVVLFGERAAEKLALELMNSEEWQPLPMSGIPQEAIYGSGGSGPLVSSDEGQPVIPIIDSGYWLFIDRHSDSDTGFFDRASFNFAVAVYDTRADLLYYYKLDT